MDSNGRPELNIPASCSGFLSVFCNTDRVAAKSDQSNRSFRARSVHADIDIGLYLHQITNLETWPWSNVLKRIPLGSVLLIRSKYLVLNPSCEPVSGSCVNRKKNVVAQFVRNLDLKFNIKFGFITYPPKITRRPEFTSRNRPLLFVHMFRLRLSDGDSIQNRQRRNQALNRK